MSSPALRCRRLRRHFGEVRAVDGIDLEIAPGEVFGLLGHNGAGKTTSVRLLCGVLGADEGEAEVLGRDPWREGSALRREVGVLTEGSALDPRLSAWEHIELFGALFSLDRSEVQRRGTELLEAFGLTERAYDRTADYSKGMRQRLALIRTFLHRPRLLFLDEPSSGLDPVIARALRERLRHESEAGHTVVLCTHDLKQAQELCHRLAILQHGRVLAEGSPRQLRTDLGFVGPLRLRLEPAQRPLVEEWLARERPETKMSWEGGELLLPGIDEEEVPELVRALSTAGVSLFRVERDEPSLEEVYLRLHQGRAP